MWEWSEGRLDIFHWMKRVLQTLTPLHPDNMVARQEFSACVFDYKTSSSNPPAPNSIEAVEAALRDGTLNNHAHSPGEIDELKMSGVFWDRSVDIIMIP